MYLDSKKTPVVDAVKGIISSKNDTNFIRLIDWVDAIKAMSEGDPRASEWTALEIIRKVIEPVFQVGEDADILDSIHPANILIPKSWLKIDPPEEATLTWEGWRRRINDSSIKFVRLEKRLSDYRIEPYIVIKDKTINRLQAIGRLLWCILRKDFSLPGAWNIRGQERALLSFIGRDLEELSISSHTLSLLEACLKPRSQETRLLNTFGFLFGSNQDEDTHLDPENIITIDDLFDGIKKAQSELRSHQVTVLNHAPRQLIPVDLKHLGPDAAMNDADGVPQS